ncbi:hypothetical protein BESB_035610 [Besnoitia besnoiti]|uniref:Uncharacterized protein n=1 Tax=Besnoitia besnoiti TaxID=94643 RepID=A0A2A9MMR3_BESBE|nr:hypothetical protein BESB_035610 [Besnoitia besnoiti]PFH37103.1 hypothetical protein BESB_035610 [Besnoitia besnoiti]
MGLHAALTPRRASLTPKRYNPVPASGSQEIHRWAETVSEHQNWWSKLPVSHSPSHPPPTVLFLRRLPLLPWTGCRRDVRALCWWGEFTAAQASRRTRVTPFRCFGSLASTSSAVGVGTQPRLQELPPTLPLYYVATLADAKVAVEWILSCRSGASSASLAPVPLPPPNLQLLTTLPLTHVSRRLLQRFSEPRDQHPQSSPSLRFGTPGRDYADVLGEASDSSAHAQPSEAARWRVLHASIGIHVPFLRQSNTTQSSQNSHASIGALASFPAVYGPRDDAFRQLSRASDSRDADGASGDCEASQRLLQRGGRTELLPSLYVSTPSAVFLFSFSPSLAASCAASVSPSLSRPLKAPGASASSSAQTPASLRHHRRLASFVCATLLANPDLVKMSHGAHHLLCSVHWQYGLSAATWVDSQIGLAVLLDRLNLESKFLSLFKALRLRFPHEMAAWTQLAAAQFRDRGLRNSAKDRREVPAAPLADEGASHVAPSLDASSQPPSPLPHGAFASHPPEALSSWPPVEVEAELELRGLTDAQARERILNLEGGGLHEALLAAHTLPFGAEVCALLGDDEGTLIQAESERILFSYARLNPHLSTPARVSPFFSRSAARAAETKAAAEASELTGRARQPPRGFDGDGRSEGARLAEAEAEEEDCDDEQGVRVFPVPQGTNVQAMLLQRESDILFFGLNLGPLAGVAVGKSVSRFPDLKPGDVVDCCVLGRSPCCQYLLLDRLGGANLVFDLKRKRMLPLPSLEDATFAPSRRDSSGVGAFSSFLLNDVATAMPPSGGDEPYKLTSNASLVDMKARFTVGLDERLGKRFEDSAGRPKPYIGQKIYKLGKRGAVKIRKKLPRNMYDDDGRNK